MEEEAVFTVSPNPVRDRLLIALDGDGSAQGRFMDLTGVVRERFEIVGGVHTFDTSVLPSGVYTLVVEDPRGVVSSRMVSVVR